MLNYGGNGINIKMVHNWKNQEKAREWVNKEFANKTRGKNMTRPRQKKILKMLWKRAERKDKQGDFS